MKQAIKNLFVRHVGLDVAVLSTLLLRIWGVVAGALMMVLVPLRLSTEEQGYYFTFASLLGLQIFFELGMNQVIVQLVSHDFAHIELTGTQQLDDSNVHIAHLTSLIRMLKKWYAFSAVLFFAVVSVAGSVFLYLKGNLALVNWLGPWILLAFASAANLYLSASVTVMEGCGQLAAVAKMRLMQSIAGYAFVWIAFALNAGLWAIPLLNLVAVGYTLYWLNFDKNSMRKLLIDHDSINNNSPISWKRDIFPFQWRIAVSWISGYFIFQLFTPIVFAKFGANEAGRIGITLAVFSSLLVVGMSWINAKVPTMAAMVSRGEFNKLNILFVQLARQSMLFVIVAIFGVIISQYIFIEMRLGFVLRFAEMPIVACLAVMTISNCFISAAAAYMRAHLEEPMMWVSLVSGVATLFAAIYGSQISLFFMMCLCVIVNICVVLPWTTIILMRYFRRNSL